MTTDKIQQEVMDLFDRRAEDLGPEEYRDLCENLASDFQCKYDAACEEIGDDEDA